MTNEAVAKKERKTDPDSVRIRGVKEAVAKRDAAKAALAKAEARVTKADGEIVDLIDEAPDTLQAHLRWLAGMP